MSSSTDGAEKSKARRDLITWTVATLGALVAAIVGIKTILAPTTKEATAAAAPASAAAPAATPPGTRPAPSEENSAAASGGVAIVGSVNSSVITVGAPPRDKR